ncbi:MAG: hypothetical protein GY943_38255 [Chloroflexi bacterium]|nr:hypothetical protein [Chloroflexota bacterium]
MENHPTCIRCKNEMEAGFLIDSIKKWFVPLKWMRGAPKIKPILKHQYDRGVYRVKAYRCSACGYLELYAKNNILEE